jgi:propionate CoA-transferase
MDAYADLIKHIDETYYRSVHRYTTSAFLRLKLGEELGKRQLSPRVYETVAEAQENHSAK